MRMFIDSRDEKAATEARGKTFRKVCKFVHRKYMQTINPDMLQVYYKGKILPDV